MIAPLNVQNIDEILALQHICAAQNDLFIPTSREGYLRAFQFHNFCLGCRESADSGLIAFLNCSVPTEKSRLNWGRGRLPGEQLNSVGHMNTLLIQRDRRRQGLGRDMVAAALEQFSHLGCRHIFATVNPDNRASKGLLHSFGFSALTTVQLHAQPRVLFYGLNEPAT